MDAESPKGALVFPQYYGPSIRALGPALLWFGRLHCVIAPWLSPLPQSVFQQVVKRAHEQQVPLAGLLDKAADSFNESCATVVEQSKDLQELDDRVTRLAAVGPGGQSRYREIRENLAPEVESAFGLLKDPGLMRVACCQLIWRASEYYLELSEEVDDVIDKLSQEDSIEHGRSRLLAECLVNHYLSFASSVSAIVADSRDTIELLAAIGRTVVEDPDTSLLARASMFQRDHLASTIFENTLFKLCPPISGESCDRYRVLLDSNIDTINAAKRKCYLAADKLCERQDSPESFDTLLVQSLTDLRSEVQEIADIDRASWDSFVGRLLEDRVLWAGAAGVLGGLTGALPAVTLAAAAVTVLTTVATKGIAEMRRKAKTLNQSEWCFVYQLTGRKQLNN